MLRGTPHPAQARIAPDPGAEWQTLGQMLRGTTEDRSRAGIYVLDRRGGHEFRTYAQLLEHALRVGAALRLGDISAGERVMLVQSTGFDFLGAFFGTVLLGATPVPFPPPRSEGGKLRGPAWTSTAERLGVRAVLRDADVAAAAGFEGMQATVADLLEDVPVGAIVGIGRAMPELAYIQLTSGTTGPMRGVKLTHANILSNVRGIGHMVAVGADDIGVSWIPPSNPMGLVGVICFGVYWGIDIVLLEVERFLRRPEEWLWAMARYQGTLSPSPNFGYHYAVRRCQESNLSGLDLSSWRVAMAGAEPVRAQHLESFVRRFSRYGLRRDVFMPVYGLSEATLAVTFADVDSTARIEGINRDTLAREGRAEPLPAEGARRPAERLHVVSVGRPLPGVDVLIADEAGEDVGERRVGEIWVRGPNVMAGYTDDPKSSGTLGPGRTRLHDGWLCTGDLGFVADGELFFLGRASDTIETARGRTVFAEEVELFVNAVDGVRSGSAVAFAVACEAAEDAEGSQPVDRLIVAFELQSGTERDEVVGQVRKLLGRHLGLDPHDLVALSPRSIPKTPSGKVRRFIARRLYLDERLDRRERALEREPWTRLWRRARGEVQRLGGRLFERIDHWFE